MTQGAAALRTIELDQRLGGTPVQVESLMLVTTCTQVRVVQGKEPTPFTAMFGGKMTVFQVRIALNIFSPALPSSPCQGGHASSFDGEEGQDVGIPQSYLLQVASQ